MFGRTHGINFGGIPKLLAPEISLGGNFSYDINGQFYSTTKVYGYIKKSNCKYSYHFLLGLLNSNTFWFFIQNTGYILRGGYFTFKTNYVAPFPIPNFDDANKQIINDIEKEVENILNKRERDSKCDVSCFMQRIDDLVFQLYGFTKNEIITITSMSF